MRIIGIEGIGGVDGWNVLHTVAIMVMIFVKGEGSIQAISFGQWLCGWGVGSPALHVFPRDKPPS